MDLDAPWRPACPSLRAASPLETSLGHHGPLPPGFEGGTGDYSMRIANHSLVLTQLLCICCILQVRQLRRWERWGYSSRNSGTCVWWESVSSSHPANIHLTPCSQSSGLRPRQKAQTPDREESRGKQAIALPTDLHKSASELTGPAGTQGCLLSRAWGPLGTADSGCHPYRRDTGRNSGRQELSWRENPSKVIPPTCLL